LRELPVTNPYQSPRDTNVEERPSDDPAPRSSRLVWLAVVWVGVMFLMTSFVTWSTSVFAGSFLPLKVITTPFTLEAVWILCGVPKGW